MTEIERRHIEATIFTQKMTGTPRKAVFLLGFVVALIVFAVMTWGSFGEALKQTERGAYIEAGTMRFPTWPSYWILPISFTLMVAVLVVPSLLVGQGFSGSQASWVMLALQFGAAAGTLLLGWVMDRLPAWALSALISATCSRPILWISAALRVVVVLDFRPLA